MTALFECQRLELLAANVLTRRTVLDIGNGRVEVQDIAFNAAATHEYLIFSAPSALLRITGVFGSGLDFLGDTVGTQNPQNGTIEFAGLNATIPANRTYNSLLFSGTGSVAMSPGVVLNGALQINNANDSSQPTVSLNQSVAMGSFNQASGTFNAGSNAHTIKGSFSVGANATFNAETSAFQFISSAAHQVNSSEAFYDLTINAGATVELASNLSVANDLNVLGALDAGAFDVSVVNGDVLVAGELSVPTGSLVLENSSTLGGLGVVNVHDLTLLASVGPITTALSGDITVGNVLLVEADRTLDAGSYTVRLEGVGTGAGRPLNVLGSFLKGTSTVVYAPDTSSATAISALDYHNLTLEGSPGAQMTLPGMATVSGVLNLTDTDVTLAIGGAVDLGTAGTLGEGSNENTVGEIRATGATNSATFIERGLGISVSENSPGAPGAVTVSRFSKTLPPGAGVSINTPISRYWSISNGGVPLDSRISLGFFGNSELNGNALASLIAYKSNNNGATWTPVSTMTRGNPTLVNVSGFSLWTLAPVAATTVSVESAANGSGALVSGSVTAGAVINAYAITRDAAGNFGSNPNANWSLTVTDGAFGGEFDNDTNTAQTSFNARNVGTGTLKATVSGVGSGDSGTLTISPGLPASLSIEAGDGQSAETGAIVPVDPAVKVLDLYDNAVPNASVTFVPSIGGSVTGSPATSGADGVATVGSWTLSGAPGVNTLTATVSDGMNQFSVQFSANGNMAPFALTIVEDATDAEAGEVLAPALKIQIKDPMGDDAALPGVLISVALTNGSGSLNGTLTQFSDANGVATFDDLSINVAGMGKRLTFSSPPMTSAVSAAFTITPAAASQIVILQGPTDAVAGQNIAPVITVQLRDVYDNNVPESDVSVTATLSTGTGVLFGVVTRETDSDGIATFDDLGINLVGSDKVLTFSGNSLAAASSSAFEIFPDVPSGFRMVPALTEQVAGEANALTISIVDTFGNLITDFTGTKTVVFSGASSAPNFSNDPTVTNNVVTPAEIAFGTDTELTFTNGICTEGGLMRLYRAEEAQVFINDTGAEPLGSEMIMVAVKPAALSSFELNIQSAQVNAVPFTGTNTLTALDAYGNVVADYDVRTPAADYAVTIIIESGLNGELTGNAVSQTSFINGVADVTNALTYTGTIGDGIIRAQSGSNALGTTNLSIVAGELHHFAINPIAPSITVGDDIDLTITAQDISDNTVLSFSGAGANVVVTSNAGVGDVLSGVTTANFDDGFLALHVVRLKKARMQGFLTVTGSGITGTSNTFDLQPSAATTLVFATPPGNGTTGGLIGQPIIQARDNFENSSNVGLSIGVDSVTLTMQNADGSLATATLLGNTSVFLDDDGRAAFTDLKVNAAGSYKLTAAGLTVDAVSASFTVVPATTKAVVSSSVNASVLGTQVAFTATVMAVAPGAGTPTGTVVFKDGATTLGSVVLNNGVATLATAALATGSHMISVEYAGSFSFNATTSDAIAHTVNAQPSVASISPAAGTTAGGTIVEIKGANFLSGATVTFDGVAATNIVVVSDSVITATAPAHASGSVAVIVANPSGLTATLPNGFAYNAPPVASSGIVFTPESPLVGQLITATLGVSDSEGDAVTVTFNWGDGSSGASHTYASVGVFTVVATVSDGVSTITVSQTLTIVAAASPSETISILAKKIVAKNPSTEKDSVRISGTITLPDGTQNLDGAVSERFGSISRTYTLVKGKGRNGKSSFALSGKSKKGVLESTTVKFSTRITDTLPPVISAAGVAPGASGNIVVQYAFDFGGKTYAADVPFVIVGKKKTTMGN